MKIYIFLLQQFNQQLTQNKIFTSINNLTNYASTMSKTKFTEINVKIKKKLKKMFSIKMFPLNCVPESW